MDDMGNVLAGIALLVLACLVVWSSLVQLGSVVLLARQAVTYGTVRGYWSGFAEHCLEGHRSGLFALAIAVPTFVVLLVTVPLIEHRRRRWPRAAFALMARELRAGKDLGDAVRSAQAFLVAHHVGEARASAIIETFVAHVRAAGPTGPASALRAAS